MQHVKKKIVVLHIQDRQDPSALQARQGSAYSKGQEKVLFDGEEKHSLFQVSGGPTQKDPTLCSSYSAKMEMMSEVQILLETP